MPLSFRFPAAAAVMAVALLGGCAAVPDPAPPRAAIPPQWYAPLPHSGDVVELRDWWSRFDDPLLAELIDDAQRSQPSLEQARARIAQARAGLRGAESARFPALDGTGSILRQHSEFPPPAVTATTASAGVDAAWEIDLFGGVRYRVAAARARAESSELAWHDARVSIAAETASTYLLLRACEALTAVFAQEVSSLAKTAELTTAKVKAGFDAPANSALADASAAEARNRVVAQGAECDAAVKALVQLTGQPEPALRQRLAPSSGRLPRPAFLAVPSVPAHMLSQRPDIAAVEAELAAAALDVGVADAERYPRLSLVGSVGITTFRAGAFDGEGPSWSFGPLLTLPLFDAGRRAAAVDAARARFDEVRAGYEQRARLAVREVEEALVRLDAASRREADATRAAQGFRDYFAAAQARWEVGTGSLIDQEEARRVALVAQAGLIGVQRERVAAWIALYRALGGGWEATPAPSQDRSP
jgi:NodT family efflux transporter outer membrane factor (OMF) lipoprotein